MSTIGVIIIGRNEGPRLLTCLQSIRKSSNAGVLDIVYVDSNSTDNSVAIAHEQHAHVIQLDTSVPFTAARARNAGAHALLARHPDVAFLQFLDGDTELHPTWLSHAADYLDRHPPVAVVCGRRRERFPEATVFNLLADMEWDSPIGQAHEFGGDALIRADIFQKMNGYTPTFIAGEEPEFAARLRLANHKIMRLNHEMVLHDLAMTRFSQWWKRTVRSGHALAELYKTHGRAPLYFYKKQYRSTLFWTLAVPAAILFCTLVLSWWAAILFPLAYGYLAVRVMRYRLSRGDDRDSACLYALFTTLGKFPQLLGMFTYHKNRWAKRPSTLIEYKAAAPANPPPAAVGNT